ncbi:SEM5A protein, partial [Polypterus senegalus]
QEECQNYIRVLLVNGNRLFTCGTNAFTPICTNRTLTNLTEIHDQISGMARCPYNPQHNSTALITSNGELYAATAMDFPGRDPAIYRSLGGLPPLRTAQYNSKWLNEPNFVSSYDIGNFTYFFFREIAVEHDCGKTIFSRASRVCKNDIGGRFLLEDTWTTFMKARLNCSRPGEIPFYYNELQDTFFLPELDLIYGIFTTNVNSIAASAVCVFNLTAITQVFNGPFKYQENSRSAWLPYPNPNPDFQCGTIDYGLYMNLTERNLQDAQKFILMHEVVQPVIPIPFFMEDNSRFTHIVVDVVQGKDMLYHIFYLATDYGTIKKVLSPLNQSTDSCLLEEIELFPPGKRQSIRSLQILHSKSILFVGLRSHVVKIPLMRCSFHKTYKLDNTVSGMPGATTRPGRLEGPEEGQCPPWFTWGLPSWLLWGPRVEGLEAQPCRDPWSPPWGASMPWGHWTSALPPHQEVLGGRREGTPESFRENSRHFRHTGSCSGTHLELIRDDINGPSPFIRGWSGGGRTRQEKREWRQPEEKALCGQYCVGVRVCTLTL